MLKLSLATLSVVVILAAVFPSSIVTRAQGATQFEYIRATPFGVRWESSNIAGSGKSGFYIKTAYRACRASGETWNCREFPPESALQTMLSTLGSDGWELVSVVNENPNNGSDLTYLFKRQLR